MSKVNTTLTVDPELRDKAKKAGINLSELLEKAMQDAVQGPVRIPELSNRCTCGHGRTRHVTVNGADAFVIYKCYDCLRWCTVDNLDKAREEVRL